MKRSVVFVLLTAAIGTACTPVKLVATLPPDVLVDTYQQQAASKIDVLWVVDDSGSMAPRQENLAKNFQSFLSLFSKGAIDFRIAITTTDIFKNKGQLKGSPKILTPTTPNLAQSFAANIKVGISGSPYEAGLRAAQMALELQRDTNAPKLAQYQSCIDTCSGGAETCLSMCTARFPIEFLRPDAYLYLIFVTDEQDESAEDVRYFWRSFETVKGIGNDGTVTTAAIMGDVPSNSCGATPGTRYKELSDLTGGEVGSICDASFAQTLEKLANNAVGLKRKFALSRKPNIATLQVKFKYPCNTSMDILKPCATVDRAACTPDMPGDAVALSCTPAQGGPNGWQYEEANRVIFFAGDSVPFLKARLEVQYYEEGKGPKP